MAINPVMAALAKSTVAELEEREAEIAKRVHAQLGEAPIPEGVPSIFYNWCQRHGVMALPARPETVAAFILESVDLDIDQLCNIAHDISIAHSCFADPTASFWVREAFEKIGWRMSAPRGWPLSYKPKFRTIPWQMQRYIVTHERERDAVVTTAHNKAGELLTKLREIEKANAEKTRTPEAARDTEPKDRDPQGRD